MSKKTKLGCVLVELIKPSQAKLISTPKHTSSESNEGTTEDKVFSLELKKAGEKTLMIQILLKSTILMITKNRSLPIGVVLVR